MNEAGNTFGSDQCNPTAPRFAILVGVYYIIGPAGFVATAIVGIPIGMYALNTVDPTIMKRVIAGVAAGGTVVMLIGWRLSKMPALWVTIR